MIPTASDVNIDKIALYYYTRIEFVSKQIIEMMKLFGLISLFRVFNPRTPMERVAWVGTTHWRFSPVTV